MAGGGTVIYPKITSPGVYDLPMAVYRGQPCDGLSISSSDAQIITDATPAHLQASWAEDAEEEGSKESDLGTLIHAMLLEPHRAEKQIVVIDAKDWKRPSDQAARKEAVAAGLLAVLPKHIKQAQGAVDAVMAHPVASALLSQGQAEQSWFAKDTATGLWLKARTDFYNTRRIIVDLKTVASASPAFLERRVYDGGWFMQAPFHCGVVERVEGRPAQGYAWVIVEQKPPHSVVVRTPHATALAHGHRLNQQALATIAKCVQTGQWPSWSETISELSLPSFALFKLEEEGVASESNPKRGLEALAFYEASGGMAHPFS